MLYIYGIHPVRAALANPARRIEKIYVLKEETLNNFNTCNVKHQIVDKNFFPKIIPNDAVHQGVVAYVHPLIKHDVEYLENFHNEQNQIVLILDQVSDPHNVGAILRSCAAFGVKALIVADNNCPDENSTLAKVACGALELLPIIRVVNISQTLKYLKSIGFWCYGMDESGHQQLHQEKFIGKVALIVGAEGKGIRSLIKSNCDILVKIPTGGNFSTLNVSNAAAIGLYEISKNCI